MAKYEMPETTSAVARLVRAAVRIRTLFIQDPPKMRAVRPGKRFEEA
jgi:hypothetical protein